MSREITVTVARLDPESAGWLRALPDTGPQRDAALERLYELLVRIARGEVTRRSLRLQMSGPELDGLACLHAGPPAGARTRPSRETATPVMVVARGTGTVTCGSHTSELNPKDIAAIPVWIWHQLTTRDHDLAVFGVTDRLIQDAFGRCRAEPADAIPSPADEFRAAGRRLAAAAPGYLRYGRERSRGKWHQ